LDIGVLGYIGIVWPKEHSPEVWSVPPVTPCIYVYIIYNLGARWGWVVNDITRPLSPHERTSVPIVQEVRWAPGPVWTGEEKIKISCHNGVYLKAAEKIKIKTIRYINANNFNNKIICRLHSRSNSTVVQEKPYSSTVAYGSFLAGENCSSVRATKITNCSRITN